MNVEKESVEQLSPVKKALLTIEKLQQELDAREKAANEPIAIIGMGCRFPGADNPHAFWQLLSDGREAIREVPRDRFNLAEFYDPDPETPGKMYMRYGGFLEQIDGFDAQFFKISPREASQMDPQQRLFLEVSWEALENAGQSIDKLPASQTAVFVGVLSNDYAHLPGALSDRVDGHYYPGINASFISGRLSYFLGVHGPSVTIDTACSSSLVAVHLACQSLRTGESDMALAGGVNLMLSPEISIFLCKAKAMSPTGSCRAFDKDADGMVRGEGCGVIVLKRLGDAIRAGDNVLALIRGSAVNHDGPSGGLTVPNPQAQEFLYRTALRNARVTPCEVSYVEAHGTGTALGDPVELRGLADAFCEGRTRSQPLVIGSVKTNIGHTDSAAGIAGLIKTVLILQRGEIPPSLHFHAPTAEFTWEQFPLTVAHQRTPLLEKTAPHIAGVSAFGLSGVNAHVIVEEAPETAHVPASPDRPWHVLCLSGKNEPALRELAGRYVQHLTGQPAAPWGDVCFTANTGRSHFQHRVAVAAQNAAQGAQRLSAWAAGEPQTGVTSGVVERSRHTQVAFLFTGQGAQYLGMGRQLYQTAAPFRAVLDRCDALLRPYLENPLLSVLYPAAGDTSPLDQTGYTQPALFALEYALAELWRSWGIEPAAVMGHSVGEYVAACIAGVFSLEDGLKLIAERGRLMQALPPTPCGGMAAVFADEAQVAAAIHPYASELGIAALNGPQSVVISGAQQTLKAALGALQARGIQTQPLQVSHAFHSQLMEPMLAAFEQAAHEVRFNAPHLPLVANITGQLFKPGEVPNPSYWRRHVREAVRFSTGIATLHAQGYEFFVEIGPTPTLLGMGRRCLPGGTSVWLPSLQEGRDDWQQMLESLSMLYTHGVVVDWNGFDRDYRRHRLTLPTYPFQRKRYWIDTPKPEEGRRSAVGVRNNTFVTSHHPLFDSCSRSPLVKDVLFESHFSSKSPSFLDDHRIEGMVVVPAAVYLEMVVAAAHKVFGAGIYKMEDVDFYEALLLPEDEVRTVQLVLTPENSGKASFQLISFGASAQDGQASWTLHTKGSVRIRPTDASAQARVSLADLQARCQEALSVSAYYQALRDRGLQFGPRFQGIAKLWGGLGETLGQMRLPVTLAEEAEQYHIHPALLDACMQILMAAGPCVEDQSEANIFLAVGLESFRFYARPQAELWSHALLRPGDRVNPGTFVGDLQLFDGNGQIVATLAGLLVKRARRDALVRTPKGSLDDWLYEVQWQPKAPAKLAARGLPPDYKPTPHQIAADIRPKLAQLHVENGLEAYEALLPQLDALCTQYILAALRQLGWVFPPRQRFAVAALAEQTGVLERHRRFLARLLDILVDDGILKKVGSEWEVLNVPEAEDAHKHWSMLLARFPLCDAELTLTGRCGQHLAEVLRGKRDPLQLLFPEGSLTSTEKLYQDSALFRIYNSLVHEVFGLISERLPVARTLRILEIGAGTGGTTAHLLPRLPADRTEYVFSDISQVFISRAKEKFRAYPFVQYRLLDIEQDPALQDFVPHQFDVILAADVLHATADLRQTLQRVQQLLASEGLLVLLEATKPLRFVDLIVGLTPGWWKFTDVDLRPAHALISRQKWLNVLEEMAFVQAVAIPEEVKEGVLSQQAVIIAQGPHIEPGAGYLDLSERRGPWLIFTDERGAGHKLAELFRARGAGCILVARGEVYEAVNDAHWQIDASNPEDFHRLFREAFGRGRPPCCGVIYLWALDAAGPEEITLGQLNEAQITVCGSVLFLVQAVVAAGLSGAPGLWLVSRGAQQVDGEAAPIAVSQAPLWGLSKVIALEHPELRCVRIDLEPYGAPDEIESLVTEICSGDAEHQVALRRHGRFVPRLVHSVAKTRQPAPARLDSPSRPGSAEVPLVFAADSTYLITGGLGGIGILVAQWLVAHGARHLVLMGRSGAAAVVRPALREMEQEGAQIVVARGDVSQQEQVATVLGDIARSMPPLRGIIHAAAVLDDGVLLRQTWERFAKVLAPKVQGAWNLHIQTWHMPLDFFVLFSAVATLLDPIGLGNYTAANAFLDALAHYRRRLGLPGLAINWGAWAQVGMAKVVGRSRERRWATAGLDTMPPQHALAILGRLMRQDRSQIGVMSIDWQKFIQQFDVESEALFFSELTRASRLPGKDALPAQERTEFLRRFDHAPANQRRQILLDYVRAQTAKVLRLEPSQPIDHQQPLQELGLDSLMALELRSLLGTSLGLTHTLPATLLFDYPTIEALSYYLSREVFTLEPPVKPPAELPSQGSGDLSMMLTDLEQLSADEAEALLVDELGNNQKGR